jgi:hypothetical protein
VTPTSTTPQQHLARFISVIFHPVFVPAMMFAVLIFFCPSALFGIAEKQKVWWLITMSYTSVLFPLLTVFLMWRLKFITSMNMPTDRERLGPLIASMLFYFWVFWLFHKQFHAPQLIQTLLFGVFLTTVLSFLGTIFFKISLHAAAWGGISMFGIFCILNQIEYALPIFCIALLLAGIIASARLYLNEHKPYEIYMGFIVGIIGQSIAYFIIPRI